MNKFTTLVLALIVLSFSSCTIKESIVINEDGSGLFLTSFDMSEVMTQMEDAFKDGKKVLFSKGKL